MSTCRARWAGSPPSTRCRSTVGGLSWAQVVAGDAALGAVVKDAKEQLRALPDGLTYGLLRYLNPDVDLTGSGPDHRVQLSRPPRAPGRPASPTSCGGSSEDGLSLTAAAAAIADAAGAHRGTQCRHPRTPTPARSCGPTGRGPPRCWTTARSSRLSRLWFEALAGICAHVQRGGGGLTPSDIAPARLSQQQTRRAAAAVPDRRHPAADPAAAGTAVPRRFRRRPTTTCTRCNSTSPWPVPLDPHRLRDAVHAVVDRHPHLAARFCEQFDEPVQVILRRPRDRLAVTSISRIPTPTAGRAAVRRRARRGLRPRRPAGVPGRADPHRRRSAPVCADHSTTSCSTAGRCRSCCARSSPSYYGHRLPAPGAYRRFITWLADRDLDAARAAWREVLAGFDTPTLVGTAQDRFGAGAARLRVVPGARADHRRRLASWRARATPPSAPCCRAPGRCC